ncbi:hypothetical protein EDD15DRAFT_2361367 [Pisolithus albus]|nr:hypothetical protein EDD15DRAFT_2361367 [Pisolithus albus]
MSRFCSFGDAITLPRLLRKTVMGEERTSFMPHYQIPKARLLRREMHMSPSQFSEFTSLIRSAAKRHLNCGLRPEEQDVDDVQRFMRMIHQRRANLSEEYEDSWPVMAYLEIYLLYRIRKADYLKRRFGCYRKAFNRCPDPIWFRYSHANKTGAPLKRNCQATVRAYGEKSTKHQRLCDHDANDGTIKRVYPLKNRVSVVIKKFCKKNYVIAISDSESDADGETGSGALSSFSPAASPRVIVPLCTDPVLDFLSSVRPSLAQFHTHFVNMGFVDDNALKAFFSWPADVQESMVRTELGQLRNPLQLHGLFVAIRARLESTTQTG